MGAQKTTPITIASNSNVLPGLVRWLLRFVSFTCLFSIAIGCLGLLGWASGNLFLKTVIPGSVPLQPNSAVCLILLGISLRLRKQPSTGERNAVYAIAQALAALVAVVGLLSLAEYRFGWDLGIDQLLFRVGPADASRSVRAGLMSVISATDFFLLGSALILLDRKFWGSRWPVQFFCFASGAAAIYGALNFVLDPFVFHISLQAVTAFVLLSTAIVCARPQWGLGQILVSAGPGGTLARRLFPAALVFPLMIGWIRSVGFRSNLWSWVAGTTVLTIMLLATLTVCTARLVERTDYERQDSVKALQQSEKRYHLLFENVLDGFAYCKMIFDQDGQPIDFLYLETNHAFERLTGLVAVVGQQATQSVPEIRSSYPEFFEVCGRVAATGNAERFEYEIKPGRKWFSISVYSPDRGYFAVVVDDISERKKNESLSRELAAIVESSQDAIIGARLDGTVTSWNSAAERLYSLPAASAIGKTIFLIDPRGKDGQLDEVFAEIRQGKPTSNLEIQTQRKDGTRIDVSLTVSPTKNNAGEVTGVSAIARDITQKRRTVEQLRLQGAALTATANAILITDGTGKILWVNPAFTKLTGYNFDEAISQNPRVLKSGEHAPAFYKQMWNTILAGEVWHGEVVNRRKDGSTYTEEMTITPVLSTTGEISNFVAIKQDVSTRISLEQQLRQSQKMEAIRRLAGGVAHDFNNMLMVITAYGELLKEQLGEDERLTPMTDQILSAARRAGSLTQQLLTMSRKQVLTPTILDLNTVVADMGKMLTRIIGEDIDLHVTAGKNLAHVKADASQIQQVVMNLVINARDAMPKGGRLLIETANVAVDEDYVAAHNIEAKPGSYVLLTVADSGIGMDRQLQSLIFEPFFTTKDVDKGTGLGLSIVYGVVKQSGGFISVYSEPGQGATFKIYLPQVLEEQRSRPASSLLPMHPTRAETVLLVEDESAVREAVQAFLQKRGYTVLAAKTPGIATEIIREHEQRIDLLMTDMIMPEMNGMELAAQLTQQRPEMKVLYMSGYTDRGMSDVAIGPGMNFLQKPFALTTLENKLREILTPVLIHK